MLFFEQIKAEKLASQDFRDIFEKECHICETTLKLASVLDGLPEVGRLTAELGISVRELDNLVQAEYCDPKLVMRLCRHLNVDGGPVIRECPRLGARDKAEEGGAPKKGR